MPALLAALLLPLAPTTPQDEVDYVADVEFALEALEENCGSFFETKDIDWKKVSRQFAKAARDVSSDQEHLVLLVRLLARLEDGHAAVQPLERGQDVRRPEQPETTGPGLFWCRVGKKIFVKSAWNAGEDVGLAPGMEILKVDGVKVDDWLERRVGEMADTKSFSTDQQAFYYTCHWGLAHEIGTRMKLEFKNLEGKKKKRTITFTKATPVPWGPAFFPPGMEGDKDVSWCVLESGYGYVHLRRCRGNLPERMDDALAALGDVPGLILDFRANGGGGFDHDAFMGRFVPEGERLAFARSYESAGSNPYGGPIVVIVDAGCRSAGETGSGIFKEDGRAYMIGETPTAGMSSSKTTIELPSGLFALYVSVRSNKHAFNGGRGIEGIGVTPHEIVEYDPDDLAERKDTLILRAEELLADYPKGKVPYKPEKYGWGD